jgi:sugar lactone lactonase YvrE
MQIPRWRVVSALVLSAIGLPSCGGSGSTVPFPVTVGGTVSGLAGSGLVLTDNGTDPLGVAASGSFVFAAKVQNGEAFSVQVLSQPAQPTQTCVVVHGSGTAGSADVTDVAVSCTTNPPTLSLFAGNMGGFGTLNGTGAAASFGSLTGVVVDPAGDVYVADNISGIRKVTPSGVVTTFVDLSAASGSFGQGPSAVGQLAVDASGNLYVAATSDDTIRKVTPAGVVTTLAGAAGVTGSSDGTGTAAQFNNPQGVATDAAGNVYVADTGNNTIRKITPTGVVTTFAGGPTSGAADGVGPAAHFDGPTALATDTAGNIYVADTGNCTIRKITPGGVVTTLAGRPIEGAADGVGSAALFRYPQGIAVDGVGDIYVADTANDTIRKITAAGDVTTMAGKAGVPGSVDGTGSGARFDQPRGVAVDATGTVYVADTENNTLRTISPSGAVTTLAGSAAVTGYADGVGAAARFESPQGLSTDAQGNVYVADSAADTVRKITPAAVVTTLAGLPGVPGDQDGTGTAARFDSPRAIATDAAGDLYVLENDTIRKVMPPASVTTLVAYPFWLNWVALTVDSAGDIDSVFSGGSLESCLVWQYTPAGARTLLACEGLPPQFDQLAGIATDASGNIYVSDFGNYIISKITPSGVVTTLAGQTGVHGVRDGTGADAQFMEPGALTIDRKGNLYMIDGQVIRKITPAGVVTTIAGVAGGQYGFQPGPLPGLLSANISGLAISGTSLYISMAQGVAVIENVP